VLPAYPAGLVVAGVFLNDRVLETRMRSIASTMLTPFYFIKAGLYVSLPALIPTAGLVVILLLIKMFTKFVGVWPSAMLLRMPMRERNYTTMLAG
jgi:Kef-type K+ transport system membrane component KefB